MQGRKLPEVIFKTRVRDESVGGPNPFRWQDKTTADYFAGKRIAVFFTTRRVYADLLLEAGPAYDLLYSEILKLGVDEVYCISVNDAFVMFQWAKNLGLKNVKFIPDGSGHFTRRMGMLINKEHLGFGYPSWRYSMIVKDGVVEKWFEEPGINDTGVDEDPYEVTDPDTLVKYLKSVA